LVLFGLSNGGLKAARLVVSLNSRVAALQSVLLELVLGGMLAFSVASLFLLVLSTSLRSSLFKTSVKVVLRLGGSSLGEASNRSAVLGSG